LTLPASYTNAKLISDSQRSPIDFLGVRTDAGMQDHCLNMHNWRIERAIDPADVSQRLVVSCV
jgi:hypothetical protein